MTQSKAARIVADVRSQCMLMQDDEEIIPFADMLLHRNRLRRVRALEVGLERGGTHLLWHAIFTFTTSIEIDTVRCHDFRTRFAEADVLLGHATNPLILKQVRDRAPFDLLFIDADHE